MTLTQLKYFQCLAREASVTNAALKLNISQSALSRTIAMMEEEIGFDLFDRQNKQIQLNQAGELFLSYVDKATAYLEQGERAARATHEKRERTILIAGTTQWLLDQLAGTIFRTDPGLSVFTEVQSKGIITDRLENGMLDFGITNDAISNRAIESQFIGSMPLFVVSPHPLPGAAGRRISLTALDNCSFISDRENTSWRELLNALARKSRCLFHVVYDNMLSLHLQRFQEESGAVMLVPGYVIALKNNEKSHAPGHAAPALHTYLLTEEYARIDFYLNTPVRAAQNQKEQELKEQLRQLYTAQQAVVDRMIAEEYAPGE